MNPKNILELGTSFGLTSAYLAKVCSKSKVVTIEGSKQVANIAQLNHKKLNISNITIVQANFDDVLEGTISALDSLDFVFFDGNHKREATLNYFELCLAKTHSDSVFIFDDIYWSKGMKSAWKTIKSNSKASVSIDLFHMGIIFFKTDQVKEHFTVYH